MLERIVRAHLRNAVVSEMVLTPQVNRLLEEIRLAATSLIVLGPALSTDARRKLDQAEGKFNHLLRDVVGQLKKMETELKPLWASIDPGRRSAIERTRQNLQRAFK